MLDLLYVVAGVLAIALIVGAIARDALGLARWVRQSEHLGWMAVPPPPATLVGRDYLAALVALLALWLTAAWLR